MASYDLMDLPHNRDEVSASHGVEVIDPLLVLLVGATGEHLLDSVVESNGDQLLESRLFSAVVPFS